MKYRAEIDGLRALAVLPVIFFHAGFKQFSGGFVGVDIFFVISGYLIATIIISEMAEGKFSIINFYERRARRILPALFFVMAICVPFAWLWLSPSDLKDFGQSLVAVSTFSSNILFWTESGYFDTSAELKPLLHTWSLAVEEQYYILFPIFLLITWRLGVKWILFLLSLIFMISLGMAHWGAFNKPSPTFFLLPTRVWELLVGVFASFYLKYNTYLKSHFFNQVLSILGFGMILYSIVVFDENTPFPSLYALVPTIGTVLLIVSAVPKTLIHNLLSFKPIVGIGLISYSAYLWHQPLLAFARHRIVGEISDSLVIFLCVAALILAWFSWQFVEKPFRDGEKLKRKWIFSFSLAGIAMFFLIGSLFHFSKGALDRVNFSSQLVTSFDRPLSNGCFARPNNYENKDWGCFLGAVKKQNDYIFFGDSHSLSLKDLVNNLASENQIRVFYTGETGCPPILGIHKQASDLRENCYLLNQRVFDLAKSEKVKGVIFSARWSYYTDGDYQYNGGQMISVQSSGPFTREESSATFKREFNKTVATYNKNNIEVHIISQHPHQMIEPETAYFKVAKGFETLNSVSVRREDFEKLNRVPSSAFLESSKDIRLYDVTDLFCDDDICLIGDHKGSYYFDDDHLSGYGALKLKSVIESIFIDSNTLQHSN